MHAPAVLLVAFLPMLLVASAYKYFNRADPDAGTTFAWTTRAFGPATGWLNGWAIFLADVIVMASLADIAAIYTFKLFGFSELGESKAAVIVAAVLWIAIMTWICYRGIELSARIQQVLLSAEVLDPRTVRGGRVRQGLRQPSPADSIKPSLDWFNPFAMNFGDLVVALLLAVFIYWGWDSGVSVNEESEDPAEGPGKAAVVSTILLVVIYVVVSAAAQAFHGMGFLSNEANQEDILNALGTGVLGEPLEQAADHRRAHLGVGLDADDDPADRAHDAVDGALESGHQPARASAQTLPDPDRLDARLRRALDRDHDRRCCCSPKACSPTRSPRSASRSASTTASPASPAPGTTAASSFKSARNLLLLGLAPLLGGLMLFGDRHQGGLLLRPNGTTSNPSRSSASRCRCGWASAGCSSARSSMLVSRPYFREFFSRKTETAAPDLLERRRRPNLSPDRWSSEPGARRPSLGNTALTTGLGSLCVSAV